MAGDCPKVLTELGQFFLEVKLLLDVLLVASSEPPDEADDLGFADGVEGDAEDVEQVVKEKDLLRGGSRSFFGGRFYPGFPGGGQPLEDEGAAGAGLFGDAACGEGDDVLQGFEGGAGFVGVGGAVAVGGVQEGVNGDSVGGALLCEDFLDVLHPYPDLYRKLLRGGKRLRAGIEGDAGGVVCVFHRASGFEADGFGGLALLLVCEVGVDLGGLDALVGEHLGDGVDFDAAAGKKGGVGVPEAVEGDVLGDAGVFEPMVETGAQG